MRAKLILQRARLLLALWKSQQGGQGKGIDRSKGLVLGMDTVYYIGLMSIRFQRVIRKFKQRRPCGRALTLLGQGRRSMGKVSGFRRDGTAQELDNLKKCRYDGREGRALATGACQLAKRQMPSKSPAKSTTCAETSGFGTHARGRKQATAPSEREHPSITCHRGSLFEFADPPWRRSLAVPYGVGRSLSLFLSLCQGLSSGVRQSSRCYYCRPRGLRHLLLRMCNAGPILRKLPLGFTITQ